MVFSIFIKFPGFSSLFTEMIGLPGSLVSGLSRSFRMLGFRLVAGPRSLVLGLSRSSGMLGVELVEAAGELGLGLVEGFWCPGLAVPAVCAVDGCLEVCQNIWAKVADCIYVKDFDVLLVVDVFV